MALIIAGDRSGTGKTTVTLALLASLRQKSQRIQTFKVGPDFIDPMFHREITGYPCYNLDPILTSETYVKNCYRKYSQNAEFSVIEGVMGLFDGIPPSCLPVTNFSSTAATLNFASTAHIAQLLDLPILLVIDCSRLSGSISAIVHGYRTLAPQLKFAGVVLNRVASDRHEELLKEALKKINLPILGIIRRQQSITIPDRHLGLIPTEELSNLPSRFDHLAHLANTCFDWEKLIPLLAVASSNIALLPPPPPIPKQVSNVRIGIAQDPAFSFYYPENLTQLQQLGAELIPWSPLGDNRLPENIQGLYFAGGFPEVFAAALSENEAARKAVNEAIRLGMPTYAECGGLMYLSQEIIDFENKSHPMVGILPTSAIMADKLTLGYRQATSISDRGLIEKGAIIRGHEFHRSQLTCPSTAPLFSLKSYSSQQQPISEGWQHWRLHASYLHLHFAGFPTIPQKFLQECIAFCKKDQLS